MGKQDNTMSEDDLLSALGIGSQTESSNAEKPEGLDSDMLMDAFGVAGRRTGGSAGSKSSSHSAEREAQLKEKSLRSKEWRRELEERQEREEKTRRFTSPFDNSDIDTSKSQEVIRVKAHPITSPGSESSSTDDTASATSERRSGEDALEQRRAAMQAQIRMQQAQMAKQAQEARKAGARRREEQAAAHRAQEVQQARDARRQARAEGARGASMSQASTQQVPPRSQGLGAVMPSRGAQASRIDGLPAEPDASIQQVADPRQQRVQPIMTGNGKSGTNASRNDRDRQRRDDVPETRESPLGVVLIVLAVLCVLVAASLLTGLWDISNLK